MPPFFKHQALVIFLVIITHSANASDLIRYIDSKAYPDPKQAYFVDLLTLVLEATKGEYGDYLLRSEPAEMSQGRTSLMLERNEVIDITWRMTSRDLEQKLQAIYFPILKALMGHRIFIIRKKDQSIFSKNLSLMNLKKIHLGQGHNWPDSEILLSNDFTVIKGYHIYFLEMLKKGRFDYYPRGLHEPWVEISNEPELAVEENFMIKYPAPMFFFVNKKNKRLQQRLELGLNRLLKSGEFDKFFQNHPITSGILTKAKVNKRTVFTLNNPLLSESSKELLTDERLWVQF